MSEAAELGLVSEQIRVSLRNFCFWDRSQSESVPLKTKVQFGGKVPASEVTAR